MCHCMFCVKYSDVEIRIQSILVTPLIHRKQIVRENASIKRVTT